MVVGGGIIGLATAYKVLLARPGTAVTVLEKESAVGQHQTGHNSGVLHAGLYYKPGSLKARLAVTGIREMTAFCETHGVRHEICGKLVVAATADEVPRLRELHQRGIDNGLAGLEWLEPDAAREIEPHVAATAALRVPEEGIADYAGVCSALVTEIRRMGGDVLTDAGVVDLCSVPNSGGWIAHTPRGDMVADLLVNCAGLQCDRIARMAGERPQLRIVPFRGEYYKLRPERTHLVRNLIYPVPDPAFPFLGVHFTRMIAGGVECGPNAVLASAREGYRKRDVNTRDMANALGFSGLWRFVAKYPSMTWRELQRSFSRNLFGAALRRLVPEVQNDDLLPGGAGVRAQAMLPNGDLVQDFYFLERPTALHVLNAPSPGATASLAIATEIVHRLQL